MKMALLADLERKSAVLFRENDYKEELKEFLLMEHPLKCSSFCFQNKVEKLPKFVQRLNYIDHDKAGN